MCFTKGHCQQFRWFNVECVVDGWRIKGGGNIMAVWFRLAASLTVEGSIPDCVIGISHWLHPSSLTMALEWVPGIFPGKGKPPGILYACPRIALHLLLPSEYISLIYILILSFRLKRNPIFLIIVSEGPWNINVNAWGFGTLGYFYKCWTSGINVDWKLEEKPVLTAGCTVVVTCLQGCIVCTGGYHFTAAGLK